MPESTVVEKYSYVYTGGKLMQMVVKTTTTPVDGEATIATETLNFSYDASGVPMAVNYGGTDYYYATNIQGDVMAILDTTGTAVVEYVYDAWGNLHSTTGTLAETLGEVNPLTYRGYVYDRDSDYYYLQSRYYDPEVGRFINADALVATGQGLLGNNMFAYCNNNVVNRSDPSGQLAGAIIGSAVMGIISGVASYLLGCSLNSDDVTLNGLFYAAGVGLINGTIGGVAGNLSLNGKILAALWAGFNSALSVSGSTNDRFVAFVLTFISTLLGSYVDTSAVNELAEFVVGFGVAGWTAGMADLLSACLQSIIEDDVPDSPSTGSNPPVFSRTSGCGGGKGSYTALN